MESLSGASAWMEQVSFDVAHTVPPWGSSNKEINGTNRRS